MKFVQVLVGFGLASSALVGIVNNNYFQPSTVQAQEKSSVIVQRLDATSPGITKFLRNPTLYGFACGEAPGEVTGASLNGNIMVIEYTYPAKDEIRAGKLVGEVTSDGQFTGTYNTRSRLGILQGNIAFAFSADGTADGNYGNGTGTAQIFL